MAKNVLPVDFQDDILTEDMDGRRRYKMITNADGTVSFVDATEYTQVGNNFGQAQINATNEAVNESADKNKIIDTKADLMANTQAGMIAGASAVKAAVSELTEKMYVPEVIGKVIYTGNVDTTFKLKRTNDMYDRYTAILTTVSQGTTLVGVYVIGVTSTGESINKIAGVDATIARSGDNVTVTFAASNIYSSGLLFAPQSHIM